MIMRSFLIAAVLSSLLFAAGTVRAGVLFSDDFESYADATNSWYSGTDNDPTGYVVEEREETMAQVHQSPMTAIEGAYVFDTSYGDQYLHLWRDSDGPLGVWKELTPLQQAEVAANGRLRIEVYMHNVVDDGQGSQDGWGGNIGIEAFDSEPGVYTGRAADIALRSDGALLMYENENQTTVVENGYVPNTWNKYTIDINFQFDRWSLAVNDTLVAGNLIYEAVDLNKVQYIVLSAWDDDVTRAGGRGGFDNLVVSTDPLVIKPGDADLNGVVNEIDAAALAHNWLASGEEVTWGMGDFNGDKRVDDLDATLMAANWTGSQASASVPEPGAILLTLGGLLALLIWKRLI